jgi:hypothetical protein
MIIELTAEQARALAQEPSGEGIVMIDPRTRKEYRLVTEEVFRKSRSLFLDSSEWTPEEMALLAGQAFARLDDTDYSEYLRENP